MTKYAIYARVSTTLDTQVTSYDAQVKELKARVKVLYPKYELVKIYGDYGISGTKENRPQFKAMLADAKAGKFDVIVTKSISRFARDLLVLLSALKELNEHHVTVVFLEEHIDSSKDTQLLLLSVLGSVSQMESKNTKKHIKEAYEMKHAAGKMAKPHVIAYGYRRENGETVIDAEEAEVIKQIFSWFVDDGLSRGAIAQRLNDRNIPIPRPKDGHRWHRSTLLYMLKNPKYCGRPEETLDSGEKMRFEGPAIIDEATFDTAQKLLEEYSRQPKVVKMRANKTNFQPQMYPLSGLCKCAVCGGKVTRYGRISTLTPGKYPLEYCDPANKGTPLWACLRIGGAKIYGTRCQTYMISEQYLYEMIIEAITHCFLSRYMSEISKSLGSKYYFVLSEDDPELAKVLQEEFHMPVYKETEIDFSRGIPIYEELIESIDTIDGIDKYNREKAEYIKQLKDIEKQRKRVKYMFQHGFIPTSEMEASFKELQKQTDNLIEPKTPEQVRISEEQLIKIKEFFGSEGHIVPADELRDALGSLFKDREIRRSLVRALVAEVVIGGEPRFQATIKIKGFKNPVMLRVDQRAPRRRGDHIRYDQVEFMGYIDED